MHASQSFGQVGQVEAPKTDFKSQAIKNSLIDNVKLALVAERLDCKPIHGHDIPLSLLK